MENEVTPEKAALIEEIQRRITYLRRIDCSSSGNDQQTIHIVPFLDNGLNNREFAAGEASG